MRAFGLTGKEVLDRTRSVRGSVVGVGCVRAKEAKDAVVRLSFLIVIDFGDRAVPANDPKSYS